MIGRSLAVSIVLLAPAARADVSAQDAAKATELFKAAQAIMDSKPDRAAIDDACSKFDASLALDPQIGTMLNLADCREKQGQLVAAHRLYERAVDVATQANKPGRADFARTRMTALDAQLVHVTLRVAEPTTPGLVIKVGGNSVSAGEWGKPQLVASGSIEVEASAPGRAPWKSSQTISGGAATTIDVPPLAPTATTSPPETPPPPAPASSRTWLWVGIGGGALELTSIGLGLHAKSSYDSAKSAHDASRVGSAQTEANIATGVAVAGGVALIVAGWLYLHRDGDRDRVVVAPTGNGIAVAGRF